MKALILVGGLATRLRPLSLNKPKCLFPLHGKTIIDYLLENLAKAGCTEAILAVNNLADKIQNYLGEQKYGIKIRYNLEETPLGTGGPIKLASNYLLDDDFLVLNGDILSFIDYAELMRLHKNNEKTATLTLTQVSDPTRYGVAELEEDTIKRFIEKPTKKEASSNWINAGCYALNPEILDIIPEGKCSIEREVFPKLADTGNLRAYLYHGDWIDIGIPEDYLKADKMIREGDNSIHMTSIAAPSADIQNAIIWEHSTIHRNTKVIDTIIGAYTNIGEYTEIKNSVIGDNVTIDNNLIIKDAKIWPNLHIETNINGKEIKT